MYNSHNLTYTLMLLGYQNMSQQRITSQTALNKSFKELFVDGIDLNGIIVNTIDEAVQHDKIAVHEMFHNYKDSLHRDGVVSNYGVQNWCLVL